MSEKAAQFRDWRYTAMQVLQRNGGPFRVIAIIDGLFSLEDGECCATDEQFATEAGHCNVKTISREIQTLRSLGLIITKPGWVDKHGKKVRARIIWLAVPSDLSGIHQR
ncbi:hypothetical protein [Rhizobium leguminosarum]